MVYTERDGMKSIYTYYKERLIEISGKNRSVFTRSFSKKTGYDLGRVLEKDLPRQAEFEKFLWSGGRDSFTLLAPDIQSLGRLFGLDEKSKNMQAELAAMQLTREERHRADLKNARLLRQAMTAGLEKETSDLRALQRETEDIEKETGRYELFVGYPFVYGAAKDILLKAPLLFFPVELELTDTVAELRLKKGESIRLNQALLYAYAQAKKLDTEELVTEFDNLAQSGLGNLSAVLAYLKKFGVRFAPPEHKHIYNFRKFPDPKGSEQPAVMRVCVLARYSLANSIYSDYSELEKGRITNEAAEELLRPGRPGKRKKIVSDKNHYIISDLDYAQRRVVEQVAKCGNMVVYGPPGTGKSQTIVNLISDALCKGKKVLVVSQKKAALDVVYNRLAGLSGKAMFVVDPVKERRSFYDRCLTRHNAVMGEEESDLLVRRYDEVTDLLAAETAKLENISGALLTTGPFGLSLMEMYYNSFIPGKASGDYAVYREMLKDDGIMAADYGELSGAISDVLGGKADIYYNYVETRKRNPFVQHLKRGVSIDTLSRSRARLKELLASRAAVFDEGSHPYARQILAHYDKLGDERNEKMLIKMLAAYEHPKANDFLQTSKFAFPLYPVAKIMMNAKEKEVGETYYATKRALEKFVRDYDFLKDVLTYDGWSMAVSAVLEGNEAALRNLRTALADYVKVSDLHLSLDNFSDTEKSVLKFAYKTTDSYTAYKEIISKLLPLRIYHEITKYEDTMKAELSLSVDFESIKSRIAALIAEQKELAKKICAQSFVGEYKRLFERGKNSKDYLYQISKKQSFWPLRRTMDVYGEYLLTLFPCWLLSPENVSSILPLKKNIFDLVLFDEASQVFIENTLPAIIRGRNIVVAGDAKQLRPTATFMRRYMGGADDEDLSMQAALEVESLLDLAVARFDSANITYHYRSASRELIDFSNKAFYEDRLRISPNVTKSVRNKPIVRIKVDGRWENRKNETEAREVVALIKKLIKSGRNRDTIGVITFGSEQQGCIEDMLDRECRVDAEFRTALAKETARKEDGQDVGFFVKNIENVQGDERDVIIFCVGYAVGENGRVNAHFGSLSADGGENRLNVAVTRAKKKIYVVTSIEPEELKVDTSKNNGPRLFRAYLSYVRAVSAGKKQETEALLSALCPPPAAAKSALAVPVEQQIADRLAELGYTTEINLGEGATRISVAVYDKKSDRYVLGIQLDRALFDGSQSALERDVFAARFLAQRGWKIMRVWSRDWWHDSKGVIADIKRTLDRILGTDANPLPTKKEET